MVRDLSSRNRVYAVETREGASWLLKQGVEAGGAAMVANEARAYATLQTLGEPVQASLAPFRGFDAGRGVLALGLLERAESLRLLHQRSSSAPVEPAGRLGRALGLMHGATMLPEPVASDWVPPALQLHRPGIELLHEGSAAAIEIVKVLQQTSGFSERLQELRASWQARAFVHLDVKWDNCLVWGPDGRRLALIDWEASGYGDPGWDIGSALGHYLSSWIFSVPITGETPPERFAELAARPLSSFQPAIRACWDGYGHALETAAPHAPPPPLTHVVGLAAARLLLTAFEAAQMSAQLTGSMLLHLQLALNMLERPHEAAVHVLGLPLNGGRR